MTNPFALPSDFQTQNVETNGTTLFVRMGGHGQQVMLLHGYGETGDMWAPMAADLVRDHKVIVPDLRGLGLSSKPSGGFDKKTQAGDIADMLAVLGIGQIDLVAHDIGNMVAFQFAAQHPEQVRRLVLIDAPIPGVGSWEEILKNPLLWHFRFGGPDMERLVAGRERIYLDRFWNEFSADPARFDEAARVHYAHLYCFQRLFVASLRKTISAVSVALNINNASTACFRCAHRVFRLIRSEYATTRMLPRFPRTVGLFALM